MGGFLHCGKLEQVWKKVANQKLRRGRFMEHGLTGDGVGGSKTSLGKSSDARVGKDEITWRTMGGLEKVGGAFKKTKLGKN